MTIFFGMYTYSRNSSNSLNRYFLYLSLAAFYWMIIFYLFTTARDYEEALFWRKLFLFWPFAGVVQTYFVIIFTDKRDILKNRIFYPLLYIPPLIVTFWELNGLIADNLILKSWGWVEINSFSIFFILASISALIIGLFNLYLCLHYILTIKDIQKKNQAFFVFLSMLIPIILGLGSQVFFQLLEFNFPDLTVFGWGLACIFIAIGILKSKLFILTPASAAESILTSMVSSNDFSTVVERSFDLVYALDTQGVVRYVSPSVKDILGYSRNEITGKLFYTYIDPTMSSSAINSFTGLVSSTLPEEIVKTLELKMLKKDGTYITLLANLLPILKDGAIYGVQGVAKDISNYDFIENSRKSFIAMTSHELRTPLSIIRGYADFLSQNLADLDSKIINSSFNSIIQNVQRLERLVQNVVDIDKMARASFKIRPQMADIYELLNSSIESFELLLGEQIKFDNQIMDNSSVINYDPPRIQQVIENIVQNSIKHTSNNNRIIIVELSSDNDYVKIKISDNGAGISSENLGKIFNQFVSIPTKYSVVGSGIGLYISRKIILAHDGKLTAESKGVGLGSSFTINLPRN